MKKAEFDYEENKLKNFKPNTVQEPFLNSKKRITALLAANKVGKCVTFHTLIETTHGKVKIGNLFGKNCDVLTWPNKEPRRVLNWIRKPKEECFRIILEDGQWIEAPKGHKILTTSGYLTVGNILENLPSSVFSRPQSNSVFFRLIRILDVRRYLRNIRDCLDDYLLDFHLDDVQLLSDEDSVQVFSPSPIDVQKHNLILSCMGDLVNKCKRSLLKAFGHPSSLCGDHLTLGQFSLRSNPSSSCDDQLQNENIQNTQQFSKAEYPKQSYSKLSDCQFSLITPDNDTNKIVSAYSIGVKTIYDMEVEERHNYIAGGMVHHNTAAGAIKTLRYAMQGGKVCRIVGSLGFEKGIRDIIWPELIKWCPPSRIIKQKPNSQGIITRITILGDNGKESVISCMSGDQDDMSFEGDIVDMVWIDEPPRRAIYSACLRALIMTNGPLFFTLTPLAEPWIYNEVFLSQDPDIECFQGSIYDALISKGGHLTEEAIKSFVSKIPESERDSRVYGKFKHLIGRVYDAYKPEVHLVDPFPIPKTWPVWCAIDPHTRKPNAALFLAVSPDEKWYICNEIYWNAGIQEFGREILQVASQYRIADFIIDSSAQTPDWEKKETARSMLEKIGLRTRLARKKNQKTSGIHIIKQALEGKNDTGIPWLYVFKSCRRTHFEFMNYVWNDKKNEDTHGISEEVKKVNDEMMDALLYIVVEHPRHSTPGTINIGFKNKLED